MMAAQERVNRIMVRVGSNKKTNVNLHTTQTAVALDPDSDLHTQSGNIGFRLDGRLGIEHTA